MQYQYVLSCTFIHTPFNSSSTHAGGMLLTDEADDMEMLNTEQAERNVLFKVLMAVSIKITGRRAHS